MAGELFIDLVMSGFNELPQLGKEVFAARFLREAGGGTAITACGLAALGMRCGVFGALGAEDGEWLIKRLQERGVEAGQVCLQQEEPTAFTVIATTEADRAFLSYEGANRFLESCLIHALTGNDRLSEKHVHLAYAPSPSTALELLARIRESGCTVSLDVGWRETWLDHPQAMEILRRVDIFFPNLPEGARLTQQTDPVRILQSFAASGVMRVALKLGASGAALLWDGHISFARPIPVVPLDTTGAGDSFNAGFLQAWLTGCDPELCLQRANICGALSTEAYGGITGFPSLERLEGELMRNTHA